MKEGDKNSLGKNSVCWHFSNDSLYIRNYDKAPQPTLEFIMFQNLFIKSPNVKPSGSPMRPLFTLLVLLKPEEWLTQRGLQDQSLNICCFFPEINLVCDFITSFWWMLDYSFFFKWDCSSGSPLLPNILCIFVTKRWRYQISGSTRPVFGLPWTIQVLSANRQYVSWTGSKILMGGGEDNICLSYLVLAKAFCCSWTLSWI